MKSPLRVYQDIQQQMDAVTTLPEDTEQPRISLSSRRREVLTIQVYGEVDENQIGVTLYLTDENTRPLPTSEVARR